MLESSLCLKGQSMQKRMNNAWCFTQSKNMGLNLVVLSLELLHALHQGVVEELRIREKRVLTAVSEFKVNDQQLFIDKTFALKEKEALQARS